MADISNPRGDNSLSARTRRALAKAAGFFFKIASNLQVNNSFDPLGTTVKIVQQTARVDGGFCQILFVNDAGTAGIGFNGSTYSGNYPNQLVIGANGIALEPFNTALTITGGSGSGAPGQLIRLGGNSLHFDASYYFGYVTTTNATITVCATVPIASGTTYLIEARVVARRTGGSAGTADDGASFILHATYTTKSGVVTLMGSISSQALSDVGGYAATLVISGTNVNVSVTGVVNTNIDWNTLVLVNDVK